jgi:hypothetical protein
MKKLVLILIVLTTLSIAEPPPPWAKGDAQKKDTVTMQKNPLPPPFDKAVSQEDTVFVIISNESSDIKEYYVTDLSDTNRPHMKIIQNGAIINIAIDYKFVGATGALRNVQDRKLIWSAKVPKSQQLEIDASEWTPGKYCGGVSNYKFCIVKE